MPTPGHVMRGGLFLALLLTLSLLVACAGTPPAVEPSSDPGPATGTEPPRETQAEPDASCLASQPTPCPDAPVALARCEPGHADGVEGVEGILADPPRVTGGGVILRGELHQLPTVCTLMACDRGCCNSCSAGIALFPTGSGGMGDHLELAGAPWGCAGDESMVCCGAELPSGEVVVTGDIQSNPAGLLYLTGAVACTL